MAAPEPMMTVLHLETGHVLAAISSGALAPTAEDLTGGEHLAVRVPKADEPVLVTPGLLAAARLAARHDVLADPRSYQIAQGAPAFIGAPKMFEASGANASDLGAVDTDSLSLWQVGDHLVEIRSKLDANGQPAVGKPPGAGPGMLLVRGAPLYLAT